MSELSASTPKPQPTRAAWPDRLGFYSLSPTPSPSLLSFFPLTLLGPVTTLSSAPTLSLYREFFLGYVAPYLIWLLSLPVRPSPLLIHRCAFYTFDLDVCLHLALGEFKSNRCSCMHTLTLSWRPCQAGGSRAHKDTQITHNSAQ